MTRLHVRDPGALTLVEDLGRPGLAALGVGAAGAMDRAALALANRLLGNPQGAAGLEVLLGGLRIASDDVVWIAYTGAWGRVAIDGVPVEPHTATPLAPDAELAFGPAEHGIRYCLAVRGGVAVEPVLGSRSRDTLAGIGPPPLAAGDALPVGAQPAERIPPADVVPVDPPPSGPVELFVRPGPRRDWFRAEAWERLLGEGWTVSPRSDRTGVRLEGGVLERTRAGELPSEGMLPGAIQVSPDGTPTVLAADAPVTGGYPVIAVVTNAALDRLAQLRPGQRVRLRPASGRP